MMKKIFLKLKRFFARLMERVTAFIHWMMIPPFCLFLYVAFKGAAYFFASRWGGDESVLPLVFDISVEGVISIVLILILAYSLARGGKLAAVFVSALFCVLFNSYGMWRVMEGTGGAPAPLWSVVGLSGYGMWKVIEGTGDAPLWEATAIAVLSCTASIITLLELRKYKKRQAEQAAASLVGGGDAAESDAPEAAL